MLPLQMRMSQSVKDAGEKAAAAQNRSLSSLLETLLIEHCEKEGFLKPAPKKK